MLSSDHDHIITILSREILKNRLAIFVGAGCSVAAGLPSWKQLLENLVAKYEFQTKEDNLLKLASRIERSIGRSNLVDEISDACRTPQNFESPTHELLTELDTNLYITTNYDHLLEHAFRKKGLTPHIVFNDLDLANLNPTAKTIVKLHGDIDSPSSLVITERDYRQYRSQHQGFTNWLKTKDTELTILFLGTSFDDPRLTEADDHVIEFFAENKRTHVIVLRKPLKKHHQEIDFQAELEDFEDRRRSFESERGILVLAIEQYEEIEELLREIKNRAYQARIDEKRYPDQRSALYRLRTNYYETLDKKFSEHLDATVRKLCVEIAGPDSFPSFSKARDNIDLLIGRLQNPPHRLSPETIVHGYLTLVDAFAATSRPEDISKAWEFYEKALSEGSALKEGHELARRILRAKAKLQFFKGDFQSALETIKGDDTPKGIFWRLSILLAADRLDEAFSLIKAHEPIQPEWAGEAAAILISRGDLSAAEALFEKFASKPDSFKDAYGLIRLQHKMAFAYFRRAILLEGNPQPFQVIPGELSPSANAACRKALNYLDEIQKTHQNVDPNECLPLAESLITKLHVLDFLGETVQAMGIAKNLLHVRPIPQAAATYIASRENPDNKESFIALEELLSLDHPTEGWACVMRSRLLALAGQYEKAWELLFQAKAQIHEEEEKKELAWTASELGQSVGKTDAAMVVVEELIDPDDPYFRFLFAKNLFYQDKLDQAYDILSELTKSSLVASVQSEILSLMARIHMKRSQWSLAKDFLKQSISKFNHPLNLKGLIYVCSQEKDDVTILDAATKLERLGFSDEDSQRAKAQAAFNLGRYDLSIETWQAVYEKDNAPQNAISLAQALRAKGEYEKALHILREHIANIDTPDLDCLQLYCFILESTGKPEDAFRQLDSVFDKIADRPELLVLHLHLAYRENKEDRAHQSMQRLMELQKMGKVDLSVLRRVNIEEFKEIIETSKKRREFATEQYRIGRLPRHVLCEIENRAYYMDWAVRTQEVPDNQRNSTEYTVYSTNSLRIGLRDGKNDLVQIVAPAESRKIVIDLSALITLHRLNLFNVMERRFEAVYYPQAFHWLWEQERPRYEHHQRSKALLYREIDTLLTTGKILRLELPREQNESVFTHVSRLAKKEGIPIVTAWSKKEDWPGADKGVVIWLSQVVKWLYKSGRIGEDKYRESQSLLKGTQGSHNPEPSRKLQSAARLMFDEGAIEFLVAHELLNPLLAMGVRPVLEDWTAFHFQQAVRELDFMEDVGKWQKDLEAAIRASKVFHPFPHPPFGRDRGYYWGIIEETLKFCKEQNLPLMADDRAMQMISEPGWSGKQFGTDALLQELLEQGMLTIDQYARDFVQLVKWRYRFLIPDDRVLLYLARQYRNQPLGSELTAIADYGRDCMEDVGLFLGPEPTDPPKPLGLLLYLQWIDQWAELLCSMWTDEDFNERNRLEITRKVFMQAIPPLPKGLHQEIRERLGGSEETKVLFKIIQFITDSSKCLELSGLLHEAFSYYVVNKHRQIDMLRQHFQTLEHISLSEEFRQRWASDDVVTKKLSEKNLSYDEYVKDNVLRKNLARMLVAYEGSLEIRTPSPFSDLMEKYGMVNVPIQKSDTEGEGLPRGQELPREDISILAFDGSIFKIAWPDAKKEEFAFAHDMLNHPTARIRMDAIQELMAMDQLSEPTRAELEQSKGSLTSEIKAHWEPAAYKIRQAVVKDFRYSRMHIKTALLRRISDSEIVSNAVTNLLFPSIDTAWAEAPAVAKSLNQDPEALKQGIIADFKADQKKGGDATENALNLYMQRFGFVTLPPPLDAWSLLQAMRITPTGPGQDAGDFCERVSHWADEQDDPLALVAAWEVLLGAAGCTETTAYFRGTGFRNTLSRLFLDLANPEYRSGNQKDDAKRHFYERAWEARTYLAQHYLRHLELESKEKTDDQRVLAAWWMAQKAMEALIEAMGSSGYEEKAALLEMNIIPNWIIRETIPTRIQHSLLFFAKALQSSNRYCTFAMRRHLAAAMMAFIAPSNDGLTPPGYASMTMTDEIRDAMIELLETPADLALAHLPAERHATVDLLWNRALTQTVPSILRTYYKENVELIGKRKMNLLLSAETISRAEYPDEVLNELTKSITKPAVFHAAMTFEIVRLKMATGCTLTSSLETFLRKPQVLSELVALDKFLGPLAVIALVRMLPHLYAREQKGLIKEIEEQLLNVEWGHLRNCVELMIDGVIIATLMGENNDLFKKLIAMGHSNREFNKGLGEIKENLGFHLSKVPAVYRERVRFMLRGLDAIPAAKKQ